MAGLQGAIPKMSGTDRFEARSTPWSIAFRARSYDSVVAMGAQRDVRAGSDIFPLHPLPRRS